MNDHQRLNPHPTIRIGLIGAGQIGQRHIERYRQIPGAEVVAICGRTPERTEATAKKFGIPDYYTDLRQLLEREDLDGVDVCLHNNLHSPVTMAALEAGKHVYCEKPMAGAYVDAKAMLDAAHRSGRTLSIQLSTLFETETKAARLLIEQGMLGKLYYASSAGFRRRGRPYVDGYGTPAFVQKQQAAGGALYDMGVYHLAQVLYLLGNPKPTRIGGKVYQETLMDAARRERSGYNVEELGLGFIRLEEDITLHVFESWAIHLGQHQNSFLVGREGGVQLEPFGYYRNLGDLELDSTVNLEALEWRLHTVREQGDAYDGPQEHWIAGLQGRVEPLPTAELALNTMLISEGIYLSSQLGREVTVEEVEAASRSTAVAI